MAKRGRGNKVTPDDFPKNWEAGVIQLGVEGKTLIHVAKYLGINKNTLVRVMKDHQEVADAIAQFKVEASIYWTDLAQNFATGKGINPLSNANALKYNILNRPYIGWNDKQVVEQETTVKADKSATDLFKSMLESTEK